MPFHFNYEQKYPYTQFEKINLDWILELATQLKDAAENGDFDGPPGPPGSGTATNGIVFLDNSSTFQDITDAIDEGQLPVYMTFYSGSIPIYYYCFEHGTGWATFIGFHGNNRYLLTWHSDNTKTLATNTWATIGSPNFTGIPTAPTAAANDSSDQIATTQFVQTAVQSAVQEAIQQLVIAPFSENFKQALLQLARNIAYIDGNGQTYYQALYDALYPPINIDYIDAIFNQGAHVVYDTDSLDSLKPYLNVVAYYDDQTSETLPSDAYVLSGTLTVGTSTITATYAGASDTFTVTVTQNVIESISAVFNPGSDVITTSNSLDSLKTYLTVTGTYSDSSTTIIPSADYTLSGTLTEGTCVVTVTYGALTTTFNVQVTIPRTKMIAGYNGSNNTNTLDSGPFCLRYNTAYTYDHTHKVSAIGLKVQTAGTLSLGIIEDNATNFASDGKVTSWDNLTVMDTLTINETGAKILPVNTPFVIPSGYVLVIGGVSNTCIWKYGDNGTNKGFCWTNGVSARSLGCDIYVGGVY